MSSRGKTARSPCRDEVLRDRVSWAQVMRRIEEHHATIRVPRRPQVRRLLHRSDTGQLLARMTMNTLGVGLYAHAVRRYPRASLHAELVHTRAPRIHRRTALQLRR